MASLAAWSLVVVLVMITGGSSALLLRLWVLRHDFHIAARSPVLVCVSGVTANIMVVSVVLRWLLALLGGSLPCHVLHWIQYFVHAFLATPFLIRQARLAFAFSPTLRYKLGRYIKSGPVVFGWVVLVVALAARSALPRAHSSTSTSSDGLGCFFFDDVWLLVLLFLLGGLPFGYLSSKMRAVEDAFKIRQELEQVTTIATVAGLVGITVGIFAEATRAWIAVVDGVTVFNGVNIIVASVLVPVARRGKWASRGTRLKVVAAIERRERSSNILTGELDPEDGIRSVLELARGSGCAGNAPALGAMFGNFCQKYVCIEGWDFVVDVVRYESSSETVAEEAMFQTFLHILDEYLRPTSPCEVNVSSVTRKATLFFESREEFFRLQEDTRPRILNKARDEIVSVLEQNLLEKFRKHVRLRTQCY